MVVQVIVLGYNRDRTLVDVCTSERELETLTVLQLKEKIALKMKVNLMEMELIFSGRRLNQNDAFLASCNLVHQSVIQMVIKMDGGRTAVS